MSLIGRGLAHSPRRPERRRWGSTLASRAGPQIPAAPRATMKMENILKSPTDGVIKKIAITKGVAVEKNQLLIQF